MLKLAPIDRAHCEESFYTIVCFWGCDLTLQKAKFRIFWYNKVNPRRPRLRRGRQFFPPFFFPFFLLLFSLFLLSFFSCSPHGWVQARALSGGSVVLLLLGCSEPGDILTRDPFGGWTAGGRILQPAVKNRPLPLKKTCGGRLSCNFCSKKSIHI